MMRMRRNTRSSSMEDAGGHLQIVASVLDSLLFAVVRAALVHFAFVHISVFGTVTFVRL